MNSTNRQGGDQPITQVTVSLAEIDALRDKVIRLEREKAELQQEVLALKKQIHDMTDPKKKADAEAFRRKRGLS